MSKNSRLSPLRSDPTTLFFEKVSVIADGDEAVSIPGFSSCWEWRGAHTAQGYPTFWLTRRRPKGIRLDTFQLPRGVRSWKGVPTYRKARGTQLSVVQLMNRLANGATFQECLRLNLSPGPTRRAPMYMRRLCQNPRCINPLHAQPIDEVRTTKILSDQQAVLKLVSLGVPLADAIRLQAHTPEKRAKLKDSLLPK